MAEPRLTTRNLATGLTERDYGQALASERSLAMTPAIGPDPRTLLFLRQQAALGEQYNAQVGAGAPILPAYAGALARALELRAGLQSMGDRPKLAMGGRK